MEGKAGAMVKKNMRFLRRKEEHNCGAAHGAAPLPVPMQPSYANHFAKAAAIKPAATKPVRAAGGSQQAKNCYADPNRCIKATAVQREYYCPGELVEIFLFL